MLKYEKILKDFLVSPGLTGKNIVSVDDSVAALLMLALNVSSPGKRFLLEVSSSALGEKVLAEYNHWCECMACSPRSLLLPDGICNGKRLAEAEIPRSRVLDQVLHDPPDLLILSASSLLSPVPAPEQMRQSEFVIRKGMDLPPEQLADLLLQMDYDDEVEVVQKCEFARRGGLLDVFSPGEELPARIEFFGDEVESIRLFSTESQISCGETDSYKLIMRAGSGEKDPAEKGTPDFTAYIREYSPQIVTLFPSDCEAFLKKFTDEGTLQRWQELHSSDPLWLEGIRFLDEADGALLKEEEKQYCPVFPSARHILKMIPEGAEENLSELVRQMSSSLIRQLSSEGYFLLAASGASSGDLRSLRQFLETEELSGVKNLHCVSFGAPRGILIPSLKFALFTEYELYSSPRRLASGKKLSAGKETNGNFPMEEIRSAVEETISSDLEEGDPVVHLQYGIGIYHGLKIRQNGPVSSEVLELEFEDDRTLFVPVWQSGCVSRYIGSGKGAVKLSRIGSGRWGKIKEEAAESVRNLAFDMLRLHALRCKGEGTAFPKDDLAQNLFEQAFPYTETADQLRAAEEIKADMEKDRPMDRLLCGDVGYGKTEVAMRAVFKCVMAGRQAAILVPTTVLAQQHYYNFLERFAEYPLFIETLSRFRNKQQQTRILQLLKSGKVDVVIGTHRLLQKDVEFHDLGLVVIDEEQRFGVQHKEMLKRMRTTVDVLTMTATPIPRTLYFSMAGMRDLSTIMSAPVQRLPVKTVVAQYDTDLIVGAVSRELQRGGQVYYLHNRVQTIEETADTLRGLFPGARIEVGHGQMAEGVLEKVMNRFIEGKCDILVCTTIIESGLDIPNANTMIIERADRFGLAELYQLRGRVGRWQRQAYAYLLLPPGGILSGDVRKRISAMRKYTHLGSGFKLALRDLEIRGAGNILGAEQSGHINAIGFTLYCDLLRTVTARLKGEETRLRRECSVHIDFAEHALTAGTGKAVMCFPPDYINSDRLRLDAYRRLGAIHEAEELENFRLELLDRFGRLPRETENLFVWTRIRLIGEKARLCTINCSAGRILMDRGQSLIKCSGRIPLLPEMGSPENKLRMLKGMLENFSAKNLI